MPLYQDLKDSVRARFDIYKRFVKVATIADGETFATAVASYIWNGTDWVPQPSVAGGEVVRQGAKDATAQAWLVDGSAVTQPVSGTFWQGTQPVSAATLPLPTGAATETSMGTDGSAPPPVLGSGTGIRGWLRSIYEKLTGTIAVTGTFWQGTQPVSAATLPLPTGAAQEHATAASPNASRLTDGAAFYKATTPADTQPVSGTFWQTTQPVSGTFWQATQPVSAASLPLPTGAATEATLAARLAEATFTTRINTQGQKAMAASTPVTIASDQSTLPVSMAAPSVLFRGRAATFRTPGRAGTVGQKILSLHNATGSTIKVYIPKVAVDLMSTVVKAITVAPPVIRLWKVTVLPTNGTALAKTKIGGTTTSNAAVTVLGDASADGTGSATTLTATLPTGTFLAQEFASRFITAAGYEMADRIEFAVEGEVELNALEGVVVFLDYVLATQNPTTDMWLASIEWYEK